MKRLHLFFEDYDFTLAARELRDEGKSTIYGPHEKWVNRVSRKRGEARLQAAALLARPIGAQQNLRDYQTGKVHRSILSAPFGP